MVESAILVLALIQLPQVPAQLPESPISRVVVIPAEPRVDAQDTIRLRAVAEDAQGNPIPGAIIRFVSAGGRFESIVAEDGLFTSGATGKVPVSVVATVPGTRPVVRTFEVDMVPAPAARVEVLRVVDTLLVGQRTSFEARSLSRHGDARQDRIAWRSSAPGVVEVDAEGVIAALSPGRATITASAGVASAEIAVTVLPDAVASFSVLPETTNARTGDVVRFRADARDASGRAVPGLTPVWSFTPGNGMIDEEGRFVGYDRGQYTVVAHVGSHSATATVRLVPRDVRQAAEVLGRLPRTAFTTEEVLVHPNGHSLYLGTGRGGDRMYAIDVGDPTRPMVTDSLLANTRRVNDVMTTPDGRFLVHTREGAADRRNGIVIAELSDPAHPRVIAEFTEGVTAGVHFGVHLPAGAARHARVPDEQWHRGHARRRHQRPIQTPRGGTLARARPDGGRLAARHRHRGRARLPQQLERRTHHPRRGERTEGR